MGTRFVRIRSQCRKYACGEGRARWQKKQKVIYVDVTHSPSQNQDRGVPGDPRLVSLALVFLHIISAFYTLYIYIYFSDIFTGEIVAV